MFHTINNIVCLYFSKFVCASHRQSYKKATRYEQPLPMADQAVSNYDDTQETDPDEEVAHSTGYIYSLNVITLLMLSIDLSLH